MLNVIKDVLKKLQECDKYENEIKEERKELKKKYNGLVKLLNEFEKEELYKYLKGNNEETQEENAETMQEPEPFENDGI